MYQSKTKKCVAVAALCLAFVFLLSGCGNGQTADTEKIKPAVVIMSVFEIGDMAGDEPGEAQMYYEEYFSDPEEYEITGDPCGCRLYVEGDVALCLLGEGKASSATNTTALLSDDRFDFSDSTFILSGCAGSSRDFGVVGDVYIITAAVDYELGHSVDVRELADESDPLWYRAPEYDGAAYHLLDEELADFAYELTKDMKLQTTESARECMARNFDNADWAVRDPKVMKGSSITADNYWKGEYSHQKAVYITEAYGAPDPYAATEMEDAAVALAFEKMGMEDQLLMLRSSVNVDVFLDGQTPESIWADGDKLFETEFDGFDDIFPVAMENQFKVGKAIIDEIL